MKLSKLDFGAPAAEREIHKGFDEYFFESQSYTRLKEGKKNILLGNRGSGKSAIFKMLAAHYRKCGYHVIELTPEDYSYEMLSQTMMGESQGAWAKLSAYAASWKYLIYVLVMKRIMEKSPALKKNEARSIFSYLRDNHKGFQNSPLDILISYLKRMESVKISAITEATIRTRELQNLYKLEEISHLLPILEEVCSKTPVYVFVDELDRGWDASEDAKGYVAGLFQAARSINESMRNFTIMISLRQELYDNIPSLYEDAQKVWDLIEEIKWHPDSLKRMIAKRIQFSLPELAERDYDSCWRTVFSLPPAPITETSFDFIVTRTLYRPREIIQYCSQARERALTEESAKINLSTVKAVEPIYSEHRTKDIAAEYRFQFPGLQHIFEAFRGKQGMYLAEELEDLCIRIILREIPTGTETDWFDDQEPDFLINVLWHIGFLRAYAAGGLSSSNGEKRFLGSHEISTLNLKSVEQFDVHPMFRSYLGIEQVS